MTSYNYNQYNSSAFEAQAHDRNSQIFWDAVSMTSSDRNSIALSVYHSVPELNYEENAAANQQRNDKVKKVNLNAVSCQESMLTVINSRFGSIASRLTLSLHTNTTVKR